ncbi:NAD(P)/FAD-dependent oxidoreductase [bacterium]|nr:NAD(P)/FAD-dependent oxidoreductase [bacterium]
MNNYDLIIIGAGASGLMAGILAKDKGLNFLIIEKNDRVGMKLGITGKGRCNITNHITDLNDLVNKYTHNGKFLYHAFNEFSVQDTLDFFEKRLNIPLKTERGKRVFPKSDSSLDIVNAFYNELKENILLETTVQEIKKKDGVITGVVTDKGKYMADNYILATGGKTYPVTGSTGDGYTFAESLGHTLHPTYPVLLGFKCRESFVRDLAGLTLKFVNVSVIKDSKVYKEAFGSTLFTHEGISGPTILNLSQYTYDMYEEGFEVRIDLKPRVKFSELDKRVNELLRDSGGIQIKNVLGYLMPKSLIPVVLELSLLIPEKECCNITREERLRLVNVLKGISFRVYGHEGWERAVVNTGGVDIREIDPNTMGSKVVKNLSFTGDILDVFGPTGGFNLQIAWSSSFIAVEGV